MALGSIIRGAAAVAFEITDDIQHEFTFTVEGPQGAYNVNTGERVAGRRTEVVVKGILTTMTVVATNGGIDKQGDVQLLVATTSETNMIKVNTEAIDSDVKAWFVVARNSDPAGATTELQLRRLA